jgi:hypothetical protein
MGHKFWVAAYSCAGSDLQFWVHHLRAGRGGVLVWSVYESLMPGVLLLIVNRSGRAVVDPVLAGSGELVCSLHRTQPAAGSGPLT